MINRLLSFSTAAALLFTFVPGRARAEETNTAKSTPGGEGTGKAAGELGEAPASAPAVEAPATASAVDAPRERAIVPPRPEPLDYNNRPLTPRAGGMSARLDLVINLTKGVEAEPVNFSGAAYFGVNDSLAAGVTTNVHGEIWGFGNASVAGVPSNGLCLGGTDSGCPKVFNNVSLDGLVGFIRQPGTDAALRVGADFVSLDPAAVAAHVGFFARFTGGPLAVLVDPSVQIGITKRDQGNKEAIFVPIRLGFQTSSDLNVGLVTGLAAPFDGFNDRYTIPLGVSGLFALGSRVDVGAVFAFPNAFGNGSSSDVRTLGFVGHVRL